LHLLNKILFYALNLCSTSICPRTLLTGFPPFGDDCEIPPLMEFSHSEMTTTSIHHPYASAAGISPTWRIVSVHFVDGIFPTQKCQCRLVYELFLVVLWEPKPSIMGFPPLRISHYVEEFSPQIPCQVFR